VKVKNFQLLLISFVLCSSAFAQNQVRLDSLQLELASASEDTLRINILLKISDLYASHNYLTAIDFAKQANEIAGKSGIKEREARAESAIANIFTAMGDYKNASKHYFLALRFYESENDSLRILSMHNNLGVVYDRLEEFDKALSHYFIARDMFNHLRPVQQNLFPVPSLYNNIANIYQTKGDFKSALEYYEKSLSLAVDNNNKVVEGIALNNLGKLHFLDLKDPEKALDYLLRGLAVREAYGDKGEIAKSLVVLGKYYLDNHNLAEGRRYSERAIALGSEIGSLDILKNGYSSLSEIEEAAGRHQQALDAYKTFKHFNDSIQNQFAHSEITRLQLQYDFEKTETQREEKAAQSRIRYITTIVVLSTGLLLAILITIIIRSRARQTELKQKNLVQDVEIKNKELTTNVMYLIRKNELINNVAERLLQVQETIQTQHHKEVHDIILDLQREADNDSWKEFELRFNQVHSDFYNNLRKLYPGLSPAEEKLCAFLRLNMSSKEIAAISQQSIKSVEVARARLRKKLNLTNTTSNLVTHLSNL
jgi:tetratricopeptide (TPR) repeat protein